jgi:hypothetical protein
VDTTCCADAACGHGLSRFTGGRILSFAIILLPIALAPFGSKAALNQVLAKNRIATDDGRNLSSALKEQLEKKFAARPNAAPAAAAPAGSTPPAPPENVTAPVELPPLPGSVMPPPALPLPGQESNTPPAGVGAVTQAPTDWLVRTPDGLIVAEVIDLLYAAQDNTLRADFEGKKVQLIGQFMPDTGSTGANRFKAVRMFMTCCAADARPIATLVEVEKSPDFKEMDWIKIVGTPSFPLEKGRRISVLKAERIEKTEPVAEDMPPQ